MVKPDRDAKWLEGLRSDPPLDAGVNKLRRVVQYAVEHTLSGRGRGDDVERVTGEALDAVLAALEQFQDQCRFVTWARAVAVRAALRGAEVETSSGCDISTLAACGWAAAGARELSPRFDAVLEHKLECPSCREEYEALIELENRPVRRPR